MSYLYNALSSISGTLFASSPPPRTRTRRRTPSKRRARGEAGGRAAKIARYDGSAGDYTTAEYEAPVEGGKTGRSESVWESEGEEIMDGEDGEDEGVEWDYGGEDEDEEDEDEEDEEKEQTPTPSTLRAAAKSTYNKARHLLSTMPPGERADKAARLLREVKRDLERGGTGNVEYNGIEEFDEDNSNGHNDDDDDDDDKPKKSSTPARTSKTPRGDEKAAKTVAFAATARESRTTGSGAGKTGAGSRGGRGIVMKDRGEERVGLGEGVAFTSGGTGSARRTGTSTTPPNRKTKSTSTSTSTTPLPAYTQTDTTLYTTLSHLQTLTTHLSHTHFSHPNPNTPPPTWYASLPPSTARVLGCVASCGPGGVAGWHDMFVDQGKREAVVCAVVGNVLVEQVFGHLMFGGGEEGVRGVRGVEEECAEWDGFDRNAQYATYIASLLENKEAADELDFRLPPTFNAHVVHIIHALWTHLAPIYTLCHGTQGTHNTTTPIPAPIFAALHKIVTKAGLLSLLMRLDRHTVYYFEPLFKEDKYDADRMECINHADMRQRNPRTPVEKLGKAEQERRAGLSETEKQRARGDEALTQITIMRGLCAYRRGGWETGDSTAEEPKFEDPAFENQGIRVRMLTHGWVYCRWGRARGYSNGKVGAGGDERLHGDAWKGGFVEFTDVEGVPNWLEMDRQERAAVDNGKAKGKVARVHDELSEDEYAAE